MTVKGPIHLNWNFLESPLYFLVSCNRTSSPTVILGKVQNRQHNGQKKKDKQRSTKHTHKTKDRVTRTQLKTGGELSCSGRVSSSCSTSGIRRVNLVTNPVISHELGKRSVYDKFEHIRAHL